MNTAMRPTLRDTLSNYPPPGPDEVVPMADRPPSLSAGCASALHDLSSPNWLQSAQEKAAAGLGISGMTTVMVRGVCTKLSQEKVKALIDEDGFLGQYDFLYVPRREKTIDKNTAQAFVNFTTSESASMFYKKYHGQKSTFSSQEKDLSVLPASRQGYDANLNYFMQVSSTHMPFFAWHELDKSSAKQRTYAA
eukprot:TRINITY_DN5773_c0_g2_i1.p1 TRINITY_DN5773_c0_g2~~TRINITY_DN5773_c0_g2_i1.p1  ORF type:complete len:193 (-),score=29.80 TRINITY_DN5773_c0_g2_i1:522-1100(-)